MIGEKAINIKRLIKNAAMEKWAASEICQRSSTEKLKFILNEVKKGKILVLEHGLTPMEQTSLIENTMREIEQDTFIGVEMEGYEQENPTFFQKIFKS